MSQGRSLFKEAFLAFINSLKPKKYWGELKGKDYFGTEYYESQEHPHRRKPSRWYTPVDKNEFKTEIPPEWEAWLRHKRRDPPTEEEIQFNVQKMKNTIENAKRLEMQRNKTIDDTKNIGSKSTFPKYAEYSSGPYIKEGKESP